MSNEKKQPTETGTVTLSEQDLETVGGGASSLSSRQTAQQASDNDISTEELTIVHEYITRAK